MSKRILNRSGWILTIVLGLLFAMSAFMKISQNEEAIAQAAASGLDANTYLLLGVVELLALILFVIPRTGIIGSLLLIAYMGGAIATHLQHQQPIAIAIVVQILLWVSVGLRFPEVLHRLFPAKGKLSINSTV
jgi:uncharacterized membrane protein YphA (DoxX/SURF4 family)